MAADGLSISIVSHGHGDAVLTLFTQMAGLVDAGHVGPCRVLLTLNRPEPALAARVRSRDWPFALFLIDNAKPAGFGANHNRAFAQDQALGASAVFGVLNPDIRLLNPATFAHLLAALAGAPGAGCVYPKQVDAAGAAQDHERRLPTLGRLLARRLGQQRLEVAVDRAVAPDWVNAAFLLLRRTAFAQVGGFDERYHMYAEDVDLCLRLRWAGWSLQRVDSAVVEHGAQRASHRDLRHLAWHVASLLRLWRSPAYRHFRRLTADSAPSR